MSTKSFTPLLTFSVSVSREVDKVDTRVEDGKTITETTKVTKTVNVPFCFKKPSRPEDEEADIVRASSWYRFVDRGVIPEAMLIKRYTEAGGTMPAQYKQLLDTLQVEFFALEMELTKAEVEHKGNDEVLRPLRLKYFDLRERMTQIHRSQAPFFENTAESKAREKHVEWLVLHMAHFKPHRADETQGEWTPFFEGETTDQKLASYDRMVEAKDELLAGAQETLKLVALFYSSSNGKMTTQQVEALVDEEKLASE